MPRVQVHIEGITQDKQDVGGDDEQMTSRIHCTFVVDGRSYPSYVDIKQTVGADYATGPLEVSAPADYPGPIDLEAVREEMTAYYRRAVHVGPGFQGRVRMRNNRFISPTRSASRPTPRQLAGKSTT